MAVYKEGYMIINSFLKSSIEIFPGESADFGVPVRKGDSFWKDSKQLIDFYGVKGTRKVEKYSTGRSVSQRVSLINEGTGKTENFQIDFVSCTTGKCKGYEGYITVYKTN